MSNPDFPDFSHLSPVDRVYYDRIFNMSGTERVMRSCSMFDFVKRMVAHQVHLASPDLGEREIRIKVAERMYCADFETLRLIERLRHP